MRRLGEAARGTRIGRSGRLGSRRRASVALESFSRSPFTEELLAMVIDLPLPLLKWVCVEGRDRPTALRLRLAAATGGLRTRGAPGAGGSALHYEVLGVRKAIG